MAFFKYYLLPAKQCAHAIQLYKFTENIALTAKRDLLAKYGADELIRDHSYPRGLGWYVKPAISKHGFSVPKLTPDGKYWLQKPKLNTLCGKETWMEMKAVCEIFHLWETSLERALGVKGYVFGFYCGTRNFLSSKAYPLHDGRIVLLFPMRDRTDPEYDGNRPMACPHYAIEIDVEEAERLVGEPIP